MTIPSTTRKAGPLLGNDTQTEWPFTFKVFSTSDIVVTIADEIGVETTLVLDTDYTVALNPNQNTSPGGTVTYPVSGDPLAAGHVLSIAGDVDYDQPLSVPIGGNFNPTTFERQLDRMVMQIQQLREQLNRAVRVGVTSDADATLPPPAASNIIGWDSTGSALQNTPLTELATAIAFATYRYDTFTGDGVETTFALSADPVSLGNIDVSVDGITYVPGVDHTLVGTSLVFTTPPPNGTEILARYGQALPPTALASANEVTFTPAGGVSRTVESKLRDMVSVADHVDLSTALSAANSALLPLQAAPTINVTHEPPLGGGAVPTNGYMKQGLISGHIGIGNGITGVNAVVGLQGNEYYTNPEQEVRGVSYVVRNARTVPDEPTLGWDFFAVAGIVTVEAGNTQEIIGNQKAVVGELYFNAPSSGSYVVRKAHNFQASAPAVGANVTVTDWYGLVVNSPTGAGAITNGYGVYIQPVNIASNAAAIRLGGTGNGGRIKWPNVEITQNASSQLDIAGNTIWSSGSVGIGGSPLSTAKLFVDNQTSATGAAGYGAFHRIIPTNTSGAVAKVGSIGQAAPNTGYAGTGDVVGAQGQFNLLAAVTVATGRAIGVQGIASTAAAGTISNLVGLNSVLSNSGGATVTNGIGLLIDSHSVGTNKYGVYQAGSGLTNRFEGDIIAHANTAIPAGGTAGAGVKLSSTSNFGVFFGSGAPTLSAAKGSLYLRSDGSGTTDRAYINTNGSTTWTALTTVA